MSLLSSPSQSPESQDLLTLSHGPLGQLVCTLADGVPHVGVTPVRAFPIGAPFEHISLVSAQGLELAYVERLDSLPAAQQELLKKELSSREFMPRITRIVGVSTFATPSTWELMTDRGPTSLVLKVEEDIRRLPERGRLLITSGHGIVFEVQDMAQLDRHSRRLLERFL